jgi:hypothetical protein
MKFLSYRTEKGYTIIKVKTGILFKKERQFLVSKEVYIDFGNRPVFYELTDNYKEVDYVFNRNFYNFLEGCLLKIKIGV